MRQARDERIVGFPTPVGPRIKYGAGSEGEGVSFDKLRTNGVASSSGRTNCDKLRDEREEENGGPSWTRTTDLSLIRTAL